MANQNKSDTRARILDEAEKLIRTRGFAGFSYADLATKIEITKASIHHHFPTKELLVLEALKSYEARYLKNLQKLAASEPSTLKRIEAYGELYLEGLDGDLGCLCAILALERDILPHNIEVQTKAFFSKHLEWLTETYIEGVESQQLSAKLDPTSAAKLVLSSLEGALMLARITKQTHSFEEVLAGLVSTLAPDL